MGRSMPRVSTLQSNIITQDVTCIFCLTGFTFCYRSTPTVQLATGKSDTAIGDVRLRRQHDDQRCVFVSHGAAEKNVEENAEGRRSNTTQRHQPSLSWWAAEYRCTAVEMTGIAILVLLLWRIKNYRPNLVPASNLLDMIVIAIMTLL
ncbi:hypothetical protein CP533_0669 [Ophiocordyceps camponoti-saundersi (nom. inval.)]|nr:hypothetical protein CP533_0669 [Ophiocordyceps camponoti-saundersi (nom. inval.)]